MLLNPLNGRLRQHDGFPVLPGGFPLIGHLPAIVTALPHLLRCAEREVGDHFWLDFGPGGLALTCVHPDAFTLFKNKVTTSQLIEEVAPEIMMGSLVAQDGDLHRQVRSAMNGAFIPKGLAAAEIGPLFASIIEKRVAQWVARRSIPLLEETRDLMLSLVFRLMGIDASDVPQWRKKYGTFLQLIIAPRIAWPGTPLWRGRRARAWIDTQLRGFISDARAQADSRGLLSLLVRSFDESDDPLADANLIANLRLLILAGHDTTASTMAWILIELARRPAIWAALTEEALRMGAVPTTPSELGSYPIAEALFRETLRYHPATTMTPRKALADFELAGRAIAANTRLCIPIIHLSRHAQIYERSDEFLPERWLGRKEPIRPPDMLQFGAGPHVCIGYHLVWMELVQFSVAVALTLRKAGLRPQIVGNIDKGIRYYPTAHPTSRLQIRFA